MRRAHSVAQVRAAEAQLAAGLPPGTLMERASTGLAHACARQLGRTYGRTYAARVVLLVGAGDNGADALFAGARLARRGAQVSAVLVGEPRADALAALLAAGGRVAADLPAADLMVDGLVGIGGRGALREPAAGLVRRLPPGVPVLAVDLPSGVDADTGAVEGTAVTATRTVTFGTYKPGHLVGEGRRRSGPVELVEIGLDLPPPVAEALEAGDLTWPREPLDKYDRGVLGVAAGSQVYPGAAVLAVGAALQAGAGMVRFSGAAHPAEQVRLRWPETVVTELAGADVVQAGRVQAWVVGPGLGTDEQAAATVRAVLASDVPVLVDADALTICARQPEWLRRDAPTLLTPHDREYERFGSQVGPDRVAAARRLAAEHGVHVLLKGDATVVAGPDGPVRVNPTGTRVLATAGSGDVLSGGCGALLAQGLPVLEAASAGSYLHGRAGALSGDGLATTAERVLAAWPDAVREARA